MRISVMPMAASDSAMYLIWSMPGEYLLKRRSYAVNQPSQTLARAQPELDGDALGARVHDGHQAGQVRGVGDSSSSSSPRSHGWPNLSKRFDRGTGLDFQSVSWRAAWGRCLDHHVHLADLAAQLAALALEFPAELVRLDVDLRVVGREALGHVDDRRRLGAGQITLERLLLRYQVVELPGGQPAALTRPPRPTVRLAGARRPGSRTATPTAARRRRNRAARTGRTR